MGDTANSWLENSRAERGSSERSHGPSPRLRSGGSGRALDVGLHAVTWSVCRPARSIAYTKFGERSTLPPDDVARLAACLDDLGGGGLGDHRTDLVPGRRARSGSATTALHFGWPGTAALANDSHARAPMAATEVDGDGGIPCGDRRASSRRQQQHPRAGDAVHRWAQCGGLAGPPGSSRRSSCSMWMTHGPAAVPACASERSG
jgi:hypothetical protein